MKKTAIFSTALFVFISSIVWADTFGTGDNRFDIDFVTISGGTNLTSGITAGDSFIFTGVTNDYRIGKFEITNDQWNKFKTANGTVLGNPSIAYDNASYFTGANVPVNNLSWYEAAQFVNWLNISTGHQAAYKFTGTQGTTNYTLGIWGSSESADGTNLYRHKDAFYFLPSENEWVKAAYWNGTTLQTHAIIHGQNLHQGDGINGTGWNYYYNDKYATSPYGPWAVGSGSEELNGTFDMMGNVWEWMENPYFVGNTIYPGVYTPDSGRSVRGGSYSYYGDSSYSLSSLARYINSPEIGGENFGFRVASIPEPTSLLLLALGGMALRYRRS